KRARRCGYPYSRRLQTPRIRTRWPDQRISEEKPGRQVQTEAQARGRQNRPRPLDSRRLHAAGLAARRLPAVLRVRPLEDPGPRQAFAAAESESARADRLRLLAPPPWAGRHGELSGTPIAGLRARALRDSGRRLRSRER